jgi:hypothetical protein
MDALRNTSLPPVPAREKAFPQVRMCDCGPGENMLSKTETERSDLETQVREVPSPAPGGERARAVAYLDLWERHVSYLAVHGTVAPSGRRTD